MKTRTRNLLWLCGGVVIGMGAVLVVDADTPPSAFLAPVVHETMLKCRPTTMEVKVMDQRSRDLQTERCWQAQWRSNAAFRSALKDAGWRAVKLLMAGGPAVDGRD